MNTSKTYYPLTHPQKRLWYTEEFYDTSGYGTDVFAYKLNEDIEFTLLEKAINALIYKNDALRLRVLQKDGEIKQYVSEYKEKKFEFLDFSGGDSEAKLAKWVEERAKEPIKLLNSELSNFYLAKFRDNQGGFISKNHHAIYDGWALGLIANQVFQYYRDLKDGKEISSEKMPSYINYIINEEQYKNSEEFELNRAFWKKKFETIPDSISAKSDCPKLDKLDLKKKVFVLSKEITSNIFRYCKEQATSVFRLFFGAFYVYLSRMNSVDDLVIGTPIHNRFSPDEKNILGMFVSTVPFRINVSKDLEFKELLKVIGDDLKQIIANQKYPYDLLIQDLKEKNSKLDGLFNVMLSYQNTKYSNGVELEWCYSGTNDSHLAIHVSDRGEKGQLCLEFDYQASLFSEVEIESVYSYLLNIIIDVLSDSAKKMHEIDFLAKEEKKQLLTAFNGVNVDYPFDKTIQALFEAQAVATPDNIALIFEGSSLTYRKLNERANQLARVLRTKGVKPDDIVGIMTERSLEMVVAAIAVLKAGGAYLPLDPDYPVERLQFMLSDSKAKILLTQSMLSDKLSFDGLTINLEGEELYQEEIANLEEVCTPDNLAYLIYTSGSTGKPKGVMVEHRGVANLNVFFENSFKVNAGDRIIQFASTSFDASVWEIFMALLSGAELHILSRATIDELGKFTDYLNKHRITIATLPPTYLVNLEPANINTLRLLITAGSATSLDLVQKWSGKCTYINAYGPTESTVCATFFDTKDLVSENHNTIPIGKPIQNTTVYIVDSYNNLQPIGVAGELCIAGDMLARGYLNRAELTAEKFVANPYLPGKRMYKTGDLARWLPDGNIEFLGRIDHQVKIRGFRIELGEIENQLLEHELIKEVTVVDKEEQDGNKYLCAYIVGDAGLNPQELRDYLGKNLPDYMVPSFFIQLEKLPLTPNGKIDRKALPEPTEKIDKGVEYVAPSNELEAKLVEVWQEVLGLELIGIDSNFFNMGGHSLKATILTSKIFQMFGVEVSIRSIFKMPTIRELAEHIATAVKSKYEVIQPLPKSAYYPVSSAQKRMFILSEIEGAELGYNVPVAIQIEGNLDRQGFERAFNQLVERHESLRTSFELVNAELVQVVHDDIFCEIEYLELNPDEVEEKISNYLRPFDLGKAPLIRPLLIKLKTEAEKYIFIFDTHHIVTDGFSVNILIRDLFSLYEGMNLQPLLIQYKDFAAWQNALLRSEAIKEQKEFWLDVFAGQIPVLDLPLDFTRPQYQSFAGNRVNLRIDGTLLTKLYELAKDTDTTLYMLLLGMYNVLLYKYTGQEDIVVGSPIVGRSHAQLENIAGMFVNTLAMRNYPEGDKAFADFLAEVKENALRAYENQDYQFEELVDSLNIVRDQSRNPLFDTMFTSNNMLSEKVKTANFDILPFYVQFDIAKFDLTVEMEERANELCLSFVYCTKLFRETTIQRMIRHFERIIEGIVDNHEINLSEIETLTQEEEKQILIDFNNTKAEYPADKLIQELFEEQVLKIPGNIAVIYEDVRITYAELNAKANQLARVLRKQGIGFSEVNGVRNNSIVAIMVERSIEMIIGVMGILKAGGAYLPIDPNYPEDRIAYMINDSGTEVILTQQHLLSRANFAKPVVNLDAADTFSEDDSNLDIINTPNDLAYIIYTSGSTGKPKGVMIEHYSVINRLNWMQKMYPIKQGDVILQKTPFTFDVSVWELFWWSFQGASVCMLIPGGEKDPEQIVKAVKKNNVTVMHFVPSMLGVFLDYVQILDNLDALRSLKQVFASGEALTLKHVEKFNDTLYRKNKTLLSNLYGPTEATVDVSYFDCTPMPEQSGSIPIGKPIDNIRLYVLNRNNKLQPIGVPGELCIAGDGLARGYLNRKDLTEEKFIYAPFASGERIYKTGDLTRWLSDGNIEYLGRIDNQVKIRGFRIELGEIENLLLKHEAVNEAVVVQIVRKDGDKSLCAYIALTRELSHTEIKDFLSKDLPDYMVPTYFVRLEKMPLSANGKIDRKALPVPTDTTDERQEYTAPRNNFEARMADIWREVLGLDRVGINDDFFALGGNSLKAIQVVAKCSQYDSGISIRNIFECKTIANLSERVISANGKVTELGKWAKQNDALMERKFNKSFVFSEQYPKHFACMEGAALEKLRYENNYKMDKSLVYFTEGKHVPSYTFINDGKESSKLNPVNFAVYHLAGFSPTLERIRLSVDIKQFNCLDDVIDYCTGQLENDKVVLLLGTTYFLSYSPDYYLDENEWLKRFEFDARDSSHAFMLVDILEDGYLVCDTTFNYFGKVKKEDLHNSIAKLKNIECLKNHPIYEESQPYQILEFNTTELRQCDFKRLEIELLKKSIEVFIDSPKFTVEDYGVSYSARAGLEALLDVVNNLERLRDAEIDKLLGLIFYSTIAWKLCYLYFYDFIEYFAKAYQEFAVALNSFKEMADWCEKMQAQVLSLKDDAQNIAKLNACVDSFIEELKAKYEQQKGLFEHLRQIKLPD